MKIYRFNPETGTCLGEDFADETAMQRGKYVVPSDATTIAPPQVERGQLLVFNVNEQRWEVRSTADMVNPCAGGRMTGECLFIIERIRIVFTLLK